jgi:hypothetical protein
MKKAWNWIKPKLVWIALGAGAVLSAVIALVTLGRSRPQFGGKAQDRPNLPEVPHVDVPTVDTNFSSDLNTDVVEDYEEKKVDATDGNVVDSLNDRFS